MSTKAAYRPGWNFAMSLSAWSELCRSRQISWPDLPICCFWSLTDIMTGKWHVCAHLWQIAVICVKCIFGMQCRPWPSRPVRHRETAAALHYAVVTLKTVYKTLKSVKYLASVVSATVCFFPPSSFFFHLRMWNISASRISQGSFTFYGIQPKPPEM